MNKYIQKQEMIEETYKLIEGYDDSYIYLIKEMLKALNGTKKKY